MAGHNDNPISPTVTKVLDEYRQSLHSDEGLSNELADRLDGLLRKGRVPKIDDIDEALFSSAEKEKL